MSLPAWAAEANRLLDNWARAQAKINALHRLADKYRQRMSEANDDCREARAAFDSFMHNCMEMNADMIDVQLADDPPSS